MNFKKFTLLIISAIAGIGLAGNLSAFDFPSFPGSPGDSNTGSTTPANDYTLFICRDIGQTLPVTGSSSCENTSTSSSSCSTSSTNAGSNEVVSWESTKDIDHSTFTGTCVEVMQAVGNCAVKGAFDNGDLVVEC